MRTVADSAPSTRGLLGLAVISPLVLTLGVGASAPVAKPVLETTVTPLAAVVPTPDGESGVSVVAAKKVPRPFQTAGSALSAPPPTAVVTSPGSLRIPTVALNAYRNAERMMAASAPGCGMSWNLLAGIGRIESMHANGGATDVNGTAVRPILGPALDGTLPGNEIIVQSRSNDRVTYARAMGPMQFLPGTWSRYASDGNGDGKTEVQNLYDATLAAARYLCSGGLSMRDQNQVMTAILRYNNSVAYARNVLGWAAAYATGVVPVDLPPITGSVPQLRDANVHLNSEAEGLGPGLPLNALGLPSTDPMAVMPFFDLGRANVADRLPVPPGPDQPAAVPNCAVFCIGENTPAPAPAAPPAPFNPFAPPPPAAPPALFNPFAPPPPAAAPAAPFNPFAPPPPAPAAPALPGMTGTGALPGPVD
ncbi:lytic transglycosylase domain-containing protein [Mycolicibacterium diernhoferi]|uniref:Lytic transglycosylase n=1 Tax=Mycolicibacterium diernhoferi TaxID=1801 RepID=A0A1Q4H900_9MYCO|nr:lytic murein transglycosylase [Mycolicibacterium diernhoferi]OJZ63851.1 lytic transglycosylase [Mycolicibacterium diernhoferi]OPE53455.1 lytic transglycosylase [Mycolicibacterium diernhoferi]PEG54342.1 lytic transglycosylase [Mycolicibacterium diernhoferi]QYL21590.1 lytic murein transglycosylase [Mycolicibacterium diernhoferi]